MAIKRIFIVRTVSKKKKKINKLLTNFNEGILFHSFLQISKIHLPGFETTVVVAFFVATNELTFAIFNLVSSPPSHPNLVENTERIMKTFKSKNTIKVTTLKTIF